MLPKSDKIPWVSDSAAPARSLKMPRLCLDVLVGFHMAGEGVIMGCCKAPAGLGMAKPAKVNDKQNNRSNNEWWRIAIASTTAVASSRQPKASWGLGRSTGGLEDAHRQDSPNRRTQLKCNDIERSMPS